MKYEGAHIVKFFKMSQNAPTNVTVRLNMQAVVNWLVETFPSTFFKAKKKVKPLQLGIIEDILDTYERLDVVPFSKKRLRSGLNFYTSSKGYLQAQVEGANRINIFGQNVEPVTAEQAQYAKDKFAEKYGLKASKPVAESTLDEKPSELAKPQVDTDKE